MKKSRKILLYILLFVGIVFLAVLAYLYKNISKENKASLADIVNLIVNPGETVFAGKERINILCLGLDYNYTEKGIIFSKGARTDTIFLISLEINNRNINILSVPRDIRVLISPVYGYDKINAAYALGEIKQAQETIKNFLGIPIDYYVILRIKEVKSLVNALGGVEINVEKDIKYDDNWGKLHVHLKKGFQRLNGEEAVGYCRFRYDPEGDWGRIRRQQQFLKALFKEIKKPVNIIHLEKFSRLSKDFLETNLSIIQIVDLARLYKNFENKNFHLTTLTGKEETINGISYIIPNEGEKVHLINRLFLGIEGYNPSDLKIEILNGSEAKGLGDLLANKLNSIGFQIVNVANAEKKYPNTEIIDYKNNSPGINLILNYINPARIINSNKEKDSNIDFTIIIGKDFTFKN
ncbi:MAG: LCP family protein [Armatimonadetes bacterium]|nr:LCP family protein [Armatimonadota bacterium]